MTNQDICPCKNCPYRKILTYLDVHIWGDDCDKVCPQYESYLKDKEKAE